MCVRVYVLCAHVRHSTYMLVIGLWCIPQPLARWGGAPGRVPRAHVPRYERPGEGVAIVGLGRVQQPQDLCEACSSLAGEDAATSGLGRVQQPQVLCEACSSLAGDRGCMLCVIASFQSWPDRHIQAWCARTEWPRLIEH